MFLSEACAIWSAVCSLLVLLRLAESRWFRKPIAALRCWNARAPCRLTRRCSGLASLAAELHIVRQRLRARWYPWKGAKMDPLVIEATVRSDGSVTLQGLPYPAGQHVE